MMGGYLHNPGDRMATLRYWVGDDPVSGGSKSSTVIRHGKSDLTLTEQQIERIDAECEQAWAGEMAASGDTRLALAAVKRARGIK
jgi:hypothetical protein